MGTTASDADTSPTSLGWLPCQWLRGGQYLLEMTGQLIPLERCRTALTTRIVETDRNGHEIRERIIFQGRARRECGE